MLMFEPGQTVRDRYQLQRRLGENPGRETWLAQDLQTQQSVVVKLMLFGGPIQWQDIRLFDREADILQQLQHERIPPYHDRFTLDDCEPTYLGLVQAYIEGESLQDCCDRGVRFRESELQAIARQILAVLEYLHQHQPPILHRDIKPSNLMRDASGRIYLIDFGSVQTQAALPGKSFTVVGTYGYTPMEQFGGQAVPASDLYALGCTLIHLATGCPPAELLEADGRLAFASRATLSPTFTKWLRWLSDPYPSQRPQSAAAARDRLDRLTERLTSKDARATIPLWPVSPEAALKGDAISPPALLPALLRQAPLGIDVSYAEDAAIAIRWRDSLEYLPVPSPVLRAGAVYIALVFLFLALIGGFPIFLASLLPLAIIFYAVLPAARPGLKFILTLGEEDCSLVGRFWRFSFRRIPALAKHRIAAVKLVGVRQEIVEDSRRKVLWRKHVEIQTTSGQRHRLAIANPKIDVAWIADVLGSWAGVPVAREREDSGQRMLVHPDDRSF